MIYWGNSMGNLLSTREMLLKAKRENYAVPAFNIHNLETLQVVVETASEMKSPVILAGTPSTIKYAGADYLVSLAETASKRYKIPISIHLDHFESIDDIKDYKQNKPITLLNTNNLNASDVVLGECSEISGKSAGDNLMKILELSKAGYLSGFIFAPLNKTSLKKAGYAFESENKMFASYFGATSHVCEINIGCLFSSGRGLQQNISRVG